MTTLVLVTSLSKLFAMEIIGTTHRMAGDVVVLDTNDQVHSDLEKMGLFPIVLRASCDWDWEKRDRGFKKLFMPGQQFGGNFPGTDLPLWSVLAMDRFSFWYRGDESRKMYEYIMALKWDTALVSADLHTPLPWTLAYHSGREVVGVKTSSFRTREWLDLLRGGQVRFSSMVCEFESDARFLVDNGYDGGIMRRYA